MNGKFSNEWHLWIEKAVQWIWVNCVFTKTYMRIERRRKTVSKQWKTMRQWNEITKALTWKKCWENKCNEIVFKMKDGQRNAKMRMENPVVDK